MPKQNKYKRKYLSKKEMIKHYGKVLTKKQADKIGAYIPSEQEEEEWNAYITSNFVDHKEGGMPLPHPDGLDGRLTGRF